MLKNQGFFWQGAEEKEKPVQVYENIIIHFRVDYNNIIMLCMANIHTHNNKEIK